MHYSDYAMNKLDQQSGRSLDRLNDIEPWLRYLDPLRECFSGEDLENTLMEQIDKTHRRGVIDDELAERLMRHYGLPEGCFSR